MIPYEDEFLDAIEMAYPAMNIHANEEAPIEAVGLVLSDGDIMRLINQTRSPSMFSVSRAQLAERLADIDPDKHTVIAIYHSHPGGTTTLSPDDQASMRATWTDDGMTLPWITLVPDSRLAIWWLDPHYQAPRSAIIHYSPQITLMAEVVDAR